MSRGCCCCYWCYCGCRCIVVVVVDKLTVLPDIRQQLHKCDTCLALLSPIYIKLSLPIYLSIYLYIYLSIYLSIYLYIYLSIYLYICLTMSVWMSVTMQVCVHYSSFICAIIFLILYLYVHALFIYNMKKLELSPITRLQRYIQAWKHPSIQACALTLTRKY